MENFSHLIQARITNRPNDYSSTDRRSSGCNRNFRSKCLCCTLCSVSTYNQWFYIKVSDCYKLVYREYYHTIAFSKTSGDWKKNWCFLFVFLSFVILFAGPRSILWDHCYPYFGRHVNLPMGFNARVVLSLPISLACTWWPLGSLLVLHLPFQPTGLSMHTEHLPSRHSFCKQQRAGSSRLLTWEAVRFNLMLACSTSEHVVHSATPAGVRNILFADVQPAVFTLKSFCSYTVCVYHPTGNSPWRCYHFANLSRLGPRSLCHRTFQRM